MHIIWLGAMFYFFRSEPGAAELRGLARQESGRVCQRVLMIANLLEGMEPQEAGRLCGPSRTAAYEWHNRYEEEGIEGLRDRPRPGRQPLVDGATAVRLKERIVAGADLARDGVVAFRGVNAQRILKEEFDIECSLSSTYRLLHRMQLSWLVPRPRHPQADATAQAAFPQLWQTVWKVGLSGFQRVNGRGRIRHDIHHGSRPLAAAAFAGSSG